MPIPNSVMMSLPNNEVGLSGMNWEGVREYKVSAHIASRMRKEFSSWLPSDSSYGHTAGGGGSRITELDRESGS